MNEDSEIDITPENGWMFSVANLGYAGIASYQESLAAPQKNRFRVKTYYLGSLAVQQEVEKQIMSIEPEKRFVESTPFRADEIIASHLIINLFYKNELRKLINRADAENKGLMIGLVAWRGQQVLDLLDILHFIHTVSKGKTVSIVSGSGLQDRDEELEESLYAAGADILSFGGGKEISKWIASRGPQDRFIRDKQGYLLIDTQPKSTFQTFHNRNSMASSGSEVDVPPIIEMSDYGAPDPYKMSVYLPGLGCKNTCNFCAIGAHTHGHVRKDMGQLAASTKEILLNTKNYHKPSFKDNVRFYTDGARQVHSMARAIRWSDFKRDLSDIISVTKEVRTRARKFRSNSILLEVQNPNPFQRPDWLKAFFTDYGLLDTKTGLNTGMLWTYGDSLSMHDPKGVAKHLDIVDYLLTKHKKLEFHISFSFDTAQAKDDGDFLQRRISGRLVTEDQYTRINANFLEFLKTARKKPWKDRFIVGAQQLAHPAMTAEVYRKKLDFVDAYYEAGRRMMVPWLMAIALPYGGTQLATQYKGHYAPLLFMEKTWTLGHLTISSMLSPWGNQFMNGDLLDCFAVTKFLNPLHDGSDSLLANGKYFDQLLNSFMAEKTHAVRADGTVGRACVSTLDHPPKIIRVLRDFCDVHCEKASTLPKVYRAEWAHRLYSTVQWINRRERYLMENNPLYAHNRKCQMLVSETEKLRGALSNLAPVIQSLDERPHRNYVLPARVSAITSPHSKI